MQFMAHWHDEVEVLLVLEGQLILGVNQKEILLGPGQIGVSASQDIHYYARSGESTIIILIFRPELVRDAAEWLTYPQEAQGPRSLPGDKAGLVIRQIHQEFTDRSQDWEQAVLGHTAVLSTLIGRALFPKTSGIGTGMQRLRMQKALDYLAQNFREDLTMEQVASQVALSPWAFSHQFSPTVGMHFRAYLNGLRVQAARRLLTDPSRKVIDVAHECGFTSLRSFNRAYKALLGAPPRG